MVNVVNWKVEDVIAKECKIQSANAGKVIKLLNEGSTIPFIARYRKEQTGNLPPEKLHKINDIFNQCRVVIEKVEKNIKKIENTGLMDSAVKTALQSCKTIEDVEFVTERYKTKGAKTLAGRARDAGLEPLATKILNSRMPFSVKDFIPQSAIVEFGNAAGVDDAVQHIIADIFAKDIALLDKMEKLNCHNTTIVKSTLKKAFRVANVHEKIDKKTMDSMNKLTRYFDFKNSVEKILPHQTMAINRGESLKLLKVSVEFPASLQSVFKDLCHQKYISGMSQQFHDFKEKCTVDAYGRLVQPQLIRRVRHLLLRRAHAESLDVYESNLRNLVMTCPLRAVPILGLDPGFRNGCKAAVIDASGGLLTTSCLRLTPDCRFTTLAEQTLLRLVKDYRVQHIAVGDGKGCFEAVKLLTTLIGRYEFGTDLEVKFAIVRECGASKYSVTKSAIEEFTNLDPNLISAVSIARRLQDPLAEYVKMDPKSLGIGMYQHDLPDKMLEDKINSVMDDCISFVGVDVNHAPIHLLQHVSGLGPSKAQAIIDHIRKNGPFINRNQLKDVKGIKEKTFTLCAGFMRIKSKHTPSIAEERKFEYEADGDAMMTEVVPKPTTSRRKRVFKEEPNPIDQTSIHPESYDVCMKLLQNLNLDVSDVGTQSLQTAMKSFQESPHYSLVLAEFTKGIVGMETMIDIVKSLAQPLEFDERCEFHGSVMRRNHGYSANLKVNQTVVGVIQNVTTFGIFLDVGVERSAFCHKNVLSVKLGDTVQCCITNITKDKLNVDNIQKPISRPQDIPGPSNALWN